MKSILSGVVALWVGTAGGCQDAVDATDPQSDGSAQKLRANTTICEIASHPERFIGKRVVVDGCIESDGQEYTVLTQFSGYCDAGGLSPNTSPDFRPAEGFYPEPDERTCGTFAGVFRGPNMLNTRVLEIDDAQNVRIVPRQQ
ncbi:MAG TPA: hypothetical protein VF111_07155 [Thermoanaerobaculia bacterium]